MTLAIAPVYSIVFDSVSYFFKTSPAVISFLSINVNHPLSYRDERRAGTAFILVGELIACHRIICAQEVMNALP